MADAPIVVTGAAGTTGSELVRRLSGRGARVRAIVRSAARAGAIAGLPGVEVVEADLRRAEALAPALRGVARAMLISSSDPAMQDVQQSFIDAAAAAGVRHVIKLSGIIPGDGSPFRFARMHTDIERHLERSGMAYTHLRAGEFMYTYFRQIPAIVAKGVLPLPMADARTASIDNGDIAEVAAAVLTGDGDENTAYPLTGPEALTMAEVAERLSVATGRPIRYVAVSPEEAARARLAAGMPQFLSDALDELFAERRRGAESTVSDVTARVFGLRPTPFAEFAAQNAAAFRGEAPPPRT